jgi:hypothetical protein
MMNAWGIEGEEGGREGGDYFQHGISDAGGCDEAVAEEVGD